MSQKQFCCRVLGSLFVFFSVVSLSHAAATTGCFKDTVAHRQLPHQICLLTGGCETLSREYCGQQCRKLGFKLAGVEASHQCACAHELTNASQTAPLSECNEPCTGAANESCGGKLRVFVFDSASVGPPPPQPDLPTTDPRHIPNGNVIHNGGYCCQPYCSVLPDGTWSCVMTFIEEVLCEPHLTPF